MSEDLKLPIDDFLPTILTSLQQQKNLVITAAPGAGKTTRLPPALLEISTKKVLVLEPRRMAAVAAAHRIAEERSWTVGEEIGYQVRFANKSQAQTRLIFMTEALLARQMLDDPELENVDIVVLDEFHERSLHVDLALGLLRELQELGRDIKIVVMSATLNAEKISAFLGSCPVINVPGKLFDLQIHYQKNSQLLQTLPVFYDNLVQTIKEAQTKTSRDLLVFLPGAGELERTRERLADWAESLKIELIILHGSLKLEEQRQALKKGSLQRVILSTNIAESSVTLDGVDTVIDTGLAKSMKQDHRTGFSRLELGRISLSSAVQRSGRAARQFPGSCYRLWNKMDELSFSKSDISEIQRVDLSESLLFLSAQGISDFQTFSWYEKPPSLAIDNAQQFLQLAGAITAENKITPLGKKLLRFPLPVRLAKLMLIGIERGVPDLAAQICAILQEKDFLKKEMISSFIADRLECDISARLQILQKFQEQRKAPAGVGYHSLQTVDQSSRQILELARRMSSTSAAPQTPSEESIKLLLAVAFSDRLCRRRMKTERGLMVGGRGVRLQNESLVKESEFFVALNGIEGSSDSETVISLACGFTKEFILKTFQDDVLKIHDVTFIEDKGQFFSRDYRVLWNLPLDEPSYSAPKSEEVAEKLPQILAEKWDYVLKQNEDLNQWWTRYQYLMIHKKDLPENLQESLQKIDLNFEKIKREAFAQACLGESRLQAIVEKNLVYFFENIFPADITQALAQQLPAKIKVPSGSFIRVHYPEDKAPYMEVRIQEVFGWMQTPQVLFGQVPITIHLLGPNFRPVQVTANLESFWKNGYAEVRKELRIRYPKHQWPEDPSEGVPEAKGRRRT